MNGCDENGNPQPDAIADRSSPDGGCVTRLSCWFQVGSRSRDKACLVPTTVRPIV